MRQTIKISAPKLNTLKLTGELRKTVPKISYSEGIHMYTAEKQLRNISPGGLHTIYLFLSGGTLNPLNRCFTPILL